MANLWDIACSKLPKELQGLLTSGLPLPAQFDELSFTVEQTRGDAESQRKHSDKMVSWI